MKKLFLLCITLLSLNACSMAQKNVAASPLLLAQNQQTSYFIALPVDAIPAEQTAAVQLQKYLQQVTGAAFPIKKENEVADSTPQILVGAGRRAKELLPGQDWNRLGNDGIVIKTAGKHLILAGGRPRGTLYAVFQFLEDNAGCRWWTPTASTIPSKSTLAVPQQNIAYVPPFSYREHYTNSVQEDPVFATILRQNGHHQKQTPEWGGHYSLLGFVHTFSKLLPPEKYFKDHPEWYSDPENFDKPCTPASKMPQAQGTQLCLSNPAVVDELSKQALVLIEKNPDAGYISISQNDGGHFCKCPADAALAEREGSYQGPILNFVNQVAARIHQEYPDFQVETLAYNGTEQPPKTIRPAKNVIIRLAPIYADFGHPLVSDWNPKERGYLEAWSKITPQLFVWNYVTNFRLLMLPHPNWAPLGEDLRSLAAYNVKGVFAQGDKYTNGVGDFVQLRAWLMGHLLWNPQLDQEQLINEFLNGYYGSAGPYLKQYLDLIQHTFLNQQRGLSTYNTNFSFLTVDVVNRSNQLFNLAVNAVKDDKILLDRVRRERLSLDAAILYRYNLFKREAARENKPFPGPVDPQVALEEFARTAQEFGVRSWAAGVSFNTQIPLLRKMLAPKAVVELPDFAREYPPDDIIDIQQDDFYLYRKGSLTDIIEDPVASDKKAGSIIGNTKVWGIQAHLAQVMDSSSDKWHAYAMVRVDATPGSLPGQGAFISGFYDVSNRKEFGGKTHALKQLGNGQYQRIDLGIYTLNAGTYIYFYPTPKVQKVYVDRIILIREK